MSETLSAAGAFFMEDLRKFALYFRPYKLNLFAGVFFIFASIVFSLLMPYLVGQAIDDLLAGVTWEKTTYYALVILGANIISGVFLFWQRRLIINMSRHIEYDMRRDFYTHLVNQPLSFFQNNRVGDLMARATNDLAAVRQLAGPMILYTLQAVFVVIIALPLLLSISPLLTALLFITMPLVSLTVKYFGQQIHTRFEKIQGFFSLISARAQENLTGVRVVRAYAQEEAEIEKFQELNREYADRNLGLVKFSAAMRPLLQFFIGVGFVLIIAVGVPMAVRGEISAGDFTAFNLYLQRMIWPLIALGYVVNLYQRGTASLKRINELYQIEPTITDLPGVKEQPPIRGAIEFRNLTFGYGSEPVLREIDLQIEAGKTVAFVGRTGSGKSTLMSLIPRLLEAPENTVFVENVSVREYPLEQLRRSIGFVPQETFLFSDTLAANIAFGVRDASQEDIEHAADIAGLAGDIKDFPDGYETLVGERGITLSGGQKQRTAIARAILRNPRILILDDSLSAVDTYTEEKILHGLRDVRQNRTTLIVSHRISTVRDADLICVLEDGSLIEQGTHDELLRLGGEYADLYQLQLLEEELAATN
ncbi:MAG TPA: ABC transporter ATP-binding protein [Pyrinomonadaceae bacterium]|nr:ABC transporter ATP-binding protein [Pyrinomonadaceae bacterium]